MRIISAFALALMSIFPLIMASIYKYAFPDDLFVGSKSTALLRIITFALLFLALMSLSFPKQRGGKNIHIHSWLKWPSFLVGWLFLALALLAACYFWYTPPGFLGYTEPAPTTGVIWFILISTMSALFFYLSSKTTPGRWPNLQRILIIVSTTTAGAISSIVLALILLWAFPATSELHEYSYPSAATYCFITYIVWGGMIFQLNRERGKRNKETTLELTI